MKTKRHGKLIVRVKDRKIAKQRFWCNDCNRSFLFKKDNEKLSEAKKRTLVRQYLEGRSSYRVLARLHNLSKTTILKTVLVIISDLASPETIAALLKPRWSGILSVDGKYIRTFDWSVEHFRLTARERRFAHKTVLLAGIDVPTKDIPYSRLGDEETVIDLVIFFQGLKRVSYDLRVLVTDGNPDIERAARKVYGERFEHQLCHKHFLDTLRLYAKDESEENRANTEQLIELIGKALKKSYYVEFWGRTETQVKIVKYYEKKYPKLSVWIKNPRVPRTNNHIENLFRQFNLRLKTINIFRNHQNTEKYLNALILARRFTKFECCRGRNKMKNGKAPLELAGCNIDGVDYLKRLN